MARTNTRRVRSTLASDATMPVRALSDSPLVLLTGAVSRLSTGAWLGLIVALAAVLRLVGLDWDQGTHVHPDERFLTMVVTAVQWPSQSFVATYFDETTSPLNPRNVGFSFFAYGDLPLLLVKAVATLVRQTEYDQVYRVGRALNAVADLGTLGVIFLLGRKLYQDHRVALLGAALYGFSALPIQQSHFFVVDNLSVLFTTLAVYFAARILLDGRVSDYVLAGTMGGLALACKISVYPVFGLIALAAACRLGRAPDRRSLVESTLFRLVLAGVTACVVFRVFEPSAFQTPGLTSLGIAPRWLANTLEARDWVSGIREAPFTHQWYERASPLFPLANMVFWGLGLPLGLAAWTGWALGGWQLVRKRNWPQLIPVAWTALFCLSLAAVWAKTMRYFLPIYPTLALLAAWLVVWLWDRGRQGDAAIVRRLGVGRRWTRRGAQLIVGTVLVGTALYAIAFAGIYTRPHTRVSASQWILSNIPAGATVANETSWDDGLPLRVDGKDAFASGMYHGLTLDITAEDSPEKLQHILNVLDETSYIFVSTNRQHGSLPRMWLRFPMEVAYYRALFSGELGFTRVAEFTSYPRLFGLELPDDGAEEAWTVYDHPRVQIFRKTPAYTRQHVQQLLTVDWDSILKLTARQATELRNGLLLPPFDRQALASRGRWAAIFDPTSLANRLPVAAWAVVLGLVGVVAAPLLWLVAGGLPDRGYALARPVGLLLVAWPAWWLASTRMASFSAGEIALCAALLGLASTAVVVHRRNALLEFARARWRLLLFEEAVFWVAFGLFVWIRWLNPDLWHPVRGGEKPMDFAFLNAVTRADFFPPPDPWFAGGYINYYYFGFVLVATLDKLTGIVPAVAYNLAIPTFFAMLASAAFGATLGLIAHVTSAQHIGRRTLVIALLGSIFVVGIGNLSELMLIVHALQTNGTLAEVPREWWYWNATRVISHLPDEPGPITEFPFFSYLFGDLHAHVLALPYTAVAIGLLVAALREPLLTGWRAQAGLLALLALVLGALWVTNTWDLPTYTLLAAAALLLRGSHRAAGLGPSVIFDLAGRWLLVIGLAYLAFLPFHQHYASAAGGLEFWNGSRTPLSDYLTLYGFFLFVLTTAMAADLWFGRDLNPLARWLRLYLRKWRRFRRLRRLQHRLVGSRRSFAIGRASLVCSAVLALVLGGIGLFVQALGVLLTVLAALLIMRRSRARSGPPVLLWQFALLIALAGLLLTQAVEIVVLKGIDIGRMNTVFKFSMQAWVLWALAAAGAIASLTQHLPRLPKRWRTAWASAFGVLFAATLLYPLMATVARVEDRVAPTAPRGLDGMAFLAQAAIQENGRPMELRFDLDAIRWMQANLPGTPVIAEANTTPNLYSWGARFANFTGNPAVIGWDWHERQQRGLVPGDLVVTRVKDIQRAYESSDPIVAYRVFLRYGVRYFVVGELERAYFPAGQDKWLSKHGNLWDLVFDNPGVQVYRVRGT